MVESLFKLRRPVPHESERLLGLVVGVLVFCAAIGAGALALAVTSQLHSRFGLEVVSLVAGAAGATLFIVSWVTRRLCTGGSFCSFTSS